ncbi:hypothetical protein C2845_PM09G17040 [Panicum miliaceum]|uniref:Uncharacterized protein n=1 Tax=Panicum miliaceum TaxID=4540 RepID=A0A3L6RYS6_PANMI|nr:hypothetical protein C2845_PM09G17040 [Panicum miliaceum]
MRAKTQKTFSNRSLVPPRTHEEISSPSRTLICRSSSIELSSGDGANGQPSRAPRRFPHVVYGGLPTLGGRNAELGEFDGDQYWKQ